MAPARIKAAVFDIDGTLLPDVSWLRLTRDLGVSVDEHGRIFEDFKAGKIPYKQAKEELIALWRSSGRATKIGFMEIFSSWQLKQDAKPLFDYLKSKGLVTALITGSMDMFAGIVANKVGADHWYANTALVWDEAGNLSDFIYYPKQGEKKLEQFDEFCSKNSILPEECVVVGDDKNDIEIFKKSGKGIAVESPNSANLDSVAWKKIKKLDEIRLMV